MGLKLLKLILKGIPILLSHLTGTPILRQLITPQETIHLHSHCTLARKYRLLTEVWVLRDFIPNKKFHKPSKLPPPMALYIAKKGKMICRRLWTLTGKRISPTAARLNFFRSRSQPMICLQQPARMAEDSIVPTAVVREYSLIIKWKPIIKILPWELKWEEVHILMLVQIYISRML